MKTLQRKPSLRRLSFFASAPARALIIALLVAGLLSGVGTGLAQTSSLQSDATLIADQSPAPDSIVQITAEAQGLTLVPRDAIPRSGTFWLFLPGGQSVPLPCPLLSSNYPIYAITDGGQFLMDGTGGKVSTARRPGSPPLAATAVTDALEQQAQAVVNLIDFIVSSQIRQLARAMGLTSESASEEISAPMFELQSGVPYLTISPTNTNQLLITVLNDTGPANYQLWWTPVLADPAYPWTAIEIGTTGQTNFIVNKDIYSAGFFRAVWDTNSVPIWQAADPNDPGAGVLAVFIDSPANGTVLQ